jgi:glycosyltransferase involved in cell wall biosynthesis
MRIGFDAKRAFFNKSGLGNYSRNLLLSLYQYYPQYEYYLYTPSVKNSIPFLHDWNFIVSFPSDKFGRIRQAFWRRYRLAKKAQKDNINIFHGLSNELPIGINKKNIKSVVTIHDLIFMRYPGWYNPFDVAIYRKKFRYSCRIADKIIAVSKQTKDDIITYFGIDERKIEVIYQGCDEGFKYSLDEQEKREVKKRWNLPDEYLLYVGTIEKRKNLLNLVKAILQQKIDLPLIVIGKQTGYYQMIRKYIEQTGLKNVTFLKEVSVNDLPGIYQLAKVFVYPSVFEGFGIPILEALFSKVPVVTSEGSCFHEAGGTFSRYVDPGNVEELGVAIKDVLNNSKLQQQMREEGLKHARNFRNEDLTHKVVKLYNTLLDD